MSVDLSVKFKASTWLGTGLRTLLKLIPDRAMVPILSGPARGMRWTKGTGTNGCWLGTYEIQCAQFIAAICRQLPKNKAFYDVGANAGYFSVLARRVAPNIPLILFEPDPDNIASIKQNLALNNLDDYQLHECAVSDSNGILTFTKGENHATGKLLPNAADAAPATLQSNGNSAFAVPSMTLDSLTSKADFVPPGLIKMDIEGAEHVALCAAKKLLETFKPALALSVHSDELYTQCQSLIQSHGYSDVTAHFLKGESAHFMILALHPDNR